MKDLQNAFIVSIVLRNKKIFFGDKMRIWTKLARASIKINFYLVNTKQNFPREYSIKHRSKLAQEINKQVWIV